MMCSCHIVVSNPTPIPRPPTPSQPPHTLSHTVTPHQTRFTPCPSTRHHDTDRHDTDRQWRAMHHSWSDSITSCRRLDYEPFGTRSASPQGRTSKTVSRKRSHTRLSLCPSCPRKLWPTSPRSLGTHPMIISSWSTGLPWNFSHSRASASSSQLSCGNSRALVCPT